MTCRVILVRLPHHSLCCVCMHVWCYECVPLALSELLHSYVPDATQYLASGIYIYCTYKINPNPSPNTNINHTVHTV